MIGGQAGIAGHLHIGAKARVGALAGVMNDVAAGTEVVGVPAQPARAFFREIATLRRMAKRESGAGGRADDAGGCADGASIGKTGLDR